ncbi:hypothetical protein ABID97_000710 [Variovorax sp. OAS795]
MRGACLSTFRRFLFSRGRDIRPAADSLSFASPKESKQRKGDPTVCVPSLRCGQPAVLDSGGGPQNSLRSNSCGPDPASICAPRRIQKGWDRAAFAPARPQNKQPNSIPTTAARSAAVAWWPSEAKARVVPPPLCMRRGAQGFADQGSQLFERSEFCETPRNPSTAGCPVAKRRGRRQWGRLFFAYFLLAKQKKVSPPPGGIPASGSKNSTTIERPAQFGKAASPHPNPLPEEEGVSQT